MKTKRILSLVLALCVTAGLAACKKKPADSASSDYDVVYEYYDESDGGEVLKPGNTASGGGSGTSGGSGKKGSSKTESVEVEQVKDSYELTSPQEKKFTSLKGTTVTVTGEEKTTNANTKVFRQIVEKKYGVKLKFVSVKGGVAGQNQIAQMVASGSGPDAFICDEVTYLRYIYANLAQPLDKYIDTSDPLWKTVDLNDTKWGGKQYAITHKWGIPGYMIAYNKTIFKENNVKTPTELYKADKWNWETFLDTAKKMTLYQADGKTVKTYGVGTCHYGMFLFANGGPGIAEAGNMKIKATIDQKKEMEGLQLLYDLVKAKALYTGDSYTGFGKRQIAMHIEQPWNAVGAYDYHKNMKDEIGIVPLPKANDGKYYFPKSTVSVMVAKNAKNPLGGVAYGYEYSKFDSTRFFDSTVENDVKERRMTISDDDLKLYLDYSKKAVPVLSYMESLSGWWDGGYRDKFWGSIITEGKAPAEAVDSMKSVLESTIKRTTG